jgi:hypothetical protein
VSHNLLNQRFGPKEAIWRAAVDRGFGNLVAEILGSDDESAEPLSHAHTGVYADAVADFTVNALRP